jgi:hypothetical protein
MDTPKKSQETIKALIDRKKSENDAFQKLLLAIEKKKEIVKPYKSSKNIKP